ncbi:MAG: hypothetical protein AAF674_06735 [Pseudomonadota bacterium]
MTAEARISLTQTLSGDEIPVQALRLDRSLDHPVGRTELVLPAGVTPPEAGASVKLAASVAGSDVTLLTGDVVSVGQDGAGARLSVLEPIGRLNRHAPSSSWSGETAGGVIGALCREVEVPTGTMLPGLVIPHMVLGHWASLLDHAMRLARFSGAALVSAVDGTVSMISMALPIPGGAVDITRAAARAVDRSSKVAAAKSRVVGAGAMGSAGPGMTTLPLQDAALVSAGSDDAGWRAGRAAIRMLSDAVTAQLAADQRLNAAASGLSVQTPLPEDISPGDVVMVPDASGLPIRPVRVERVGMMVSGALGLRARYDFSDVGVG